MAKRQLAFVLVYQDSPDFNEQAPPGSNLPKLTELLESGWQMIRESPMGGGGNAGRFCSVIVLEKDNVFVDIPRASEEISLEDARTNLGHS